MNNRFIDCQFNACKNALENLKVPIKQLHSIAMRACFMYEMGIYLQSSNPYIDRCTLWIIQESKKKNNIILISNQLSEWSLIL